MKQNIKKNTKGYFQDLSKFFEKEIKKRIKDNEKLSDENFKLIKAHGDASQQTSELKDEFKKSQNKIRKIEKENETLSEQNLSMENLDVGRKANIKQLKDENSILKAKVKELEISLMKQTNENEILGIKLEKRDEKTKGKTLNLNDVALMQLIKEVPKLEHDQSTYANKERFYEVREQKVKELKEFASRKLTLAEKLIAVCISPQLIKYFKDPHSLLLIVAVSLNSDMISHIDTPPVVIKKLAEFRDPDLDYYKYQSEYDPFEDPYYKKRYPTFRA